MFKSRDRSMESRLNKKLVLRNSIMFSEVAKLISEGKSVTMKVKGNSMLPFIKDGETIKLVKTNHLKQYDIVLARIDDEQYVLHRIIRMKDNQLLLMGDGNLKGCERCKVEDVLALAAIKVNVKKEYDFRSDSHLKKARIWNFLLPIRRYLLFIYKLTLKIFQR